MTNGTVFYRGPSVLDGKPIVAIATMSSQNRKTGDMIQTWILRRDIDPVAAILSGKDSSICGDCVHRGKGTKAQPRTCYVNVGQAPLSVYRAYRRGSYSRGPLPTTGKPVRMGAYGDPVAVPWDAWTGIHEARRWTGYTHQWRRLEAAPFRGVLMASCDSVSEAAEAAAAGWRTFLVRPIGTVGSGIECPSPKASCATCGLCNGQQSYQAPSIWIEAHGTARRFVGAT